MQTYADKKKVAQDRDITPEQMLRMSGAGTPQPMEESLRAKFEPAFGADFSNVRISRGHIPQELGVEAVAKGTNILLDSSAGMDVLGHELAHVVQQAQGRVAPGAFPEVYHPGLEQEADRMGARAAAGERAALPGAPAGEGLMSIAPMSDASAPAQCKSRAQKARERRAKRELSGLRKEFAARKKAFNRDPNGYSGGDENWRIKLDETLNTDGIGDLQMIGSLVSSSESQHAVMRRGNQFFSQHPDYAEDGLARDMVRFLGNSGPDQYGNIEDEEMDTTYQEIRKAEKGDAGAAQSLAGRFQASVASMREQMAPLLERHNEPITSPEEVFMRMHQMQEIFKKNQSTANIGNMLSQSGLVDTNSGSLAEDLHYSNGISDYVRGNLNAGRRNVESQEGKKDWSVILPFEEFMRRKGYMA